MVFCMYITQVLEKHLIQLLNRLDGYEHVREQLEQQERPSSLNESRDSVRRHVDAQDIISKVLPPYVHVHGFIHMYVTLLVLQESFN